MINLGSVNEKSTATLTLEFADTVGTPVMPTSGTYRIDTVAGSSIKASTVFTPTTTTHSIMLTTTDNTLVNTALDSEPRIITITWVYGATQGTAEYRYSVKNLHYIT